MAELVRTKDVLLHAAALRRPTLHALVAVVLPALTPTPANTTSVETELSSGFSCLFEVTSDNRHSLSDDQSSPTHSCNRHHSSSNRPTGCADRFVPLDNLTSANHEWGVVSVFITYGCHSGSRSHTGRTDVGCQADTGNLHRSNMHNSSQSCPSSMHTRSCSTSTRHHAALKHVTKTIGTYP